MKWKRSKAKGRDVIDVRGSSPSSGGGSGMQIPNVAGLGGGVGIVVVIVIVAIQAFGGGGSPSSGGGFTIDDVFSNGLQAPGVGEGEGIPESEDPQAELKDFSDYVFGDTQDVWTDIFDQQGDSYDRAQLVLYANAVRTDGCGSATSAVGPFYCPADERVYLDLSFYEDMRRQLQAPGDFAWAYVIAHEIGHHVQNLKGTNAEVAELGGIL